MSRTYDQDLIIANNFKKPIPGKYKESDLLRIKPEQKLRFAEAFGLSPNDPNLIDRIIRILKYKNVVIADVEVLPVGFENLPEDAITQILLNTNYSSLSNVKVNKTTDRILNSGTFWRLWLEQNMNLFSADPNLDYKFIAQFLNTDKRRPTSNNLGFSSKSIEDKFMVAVNDNYSSVVKILLENSLVDPNEQILFLNFDAYVERYPKYLFEQWDTPLIIATVNNYNELINILLSDPKLIIDFDTVVNAITISIINQNLDGLGMLVKNDQIRNEDAHEGWVYRAARINNNDILDKMLRLLLSLPNMNSLIINLGIDSLIKQHRNINLINLMLTNPKNMMPSEIKQEISQNLQNNNYKQARIILDDYIVQ